MLKVKTVSWEENVENVDDAKFSSKMGSFGEKNKPLKHISKLKVVGNVVLRWVF